MSIRCGAGRPCHLKAHVADIQKVLCAPRPVLHLPILRWEHRSGASGLRGERREGMTSGGGDRLLNVNIDAGVYMSDWMVWPVPLQ